PGPFENAGVAALAAAPAPFRGRAAPLLPSFPGQVFFRRGSPVPRSAAEEQTDDHKDQRRTHMTLSTILMTVFLSLHAAPAAPTAPAPALMAPVDHGLRVIYLTPGSTAFCSTG